MPPDPNGPPGDLDTDARALYRKLRRFLEDAQRWQDSDRYILAQTCRDDQVRREALEALPRDEHGRPLMTTQGRSEFSGEVAHPLVRIVEGASKRFVEGLKELGLTPRAREQLGIKPPARGGKFGFDAS